MSNFESEPIFLCSKCPKRFANASKLRQHWQNVHSEKLFKCGTCQESFEKRSLLEAHKTLHTGKTTFVCNFCSKPYRSKNSLNKHIMRKHRREVCETADVASSPNSVRGSRQVFICAICDKSVVNRQTLEEHLLAHFSNHQPFVCKFCGHSSRLKRNLERHIRNIHKGPGEKVQVDDIIYVPDPSQNDEPCVGDFVEENDVFSLMITNTEPQSISLKDVPQREVVISLGAEFGDSIDLTESSASEDSRSHIQTPVN